ncbi:uncharacterized protein LOC134449845 [Engraulis encrasicolus]|uniref:uncharacterized protein LOC134449845 n=1 Tax=Engraulis encrasicolus TaxID=184585 RepID=UPI002FD63EEC
MADMGKLREGAKTTADFVAHFNQMFDCFNSSTLSSSTPQKDAFRETHIDFINESINWLASVRCASGNSLNCLNGWRHNLRAIKEIWAELKEKGFQFLFTRHLNQDCLEHFFGVIRAKGGHRDNPDPQQFRLDYRQAVLDYLMTFGRNTNCEPEEIHLLLQLSHLFESCTESSQMATPHPCTALTMPHESCTESSQMATPHPCTALTMPHESCTESSQMATPHPCTALTMPHVQSTDEEPTFPGLDNTEFMKGLDVIEGNVSVYLAGYVAFRASAKFDCKSCVTLWEANEEDRDTLKEKYTFFRYKQFRDGLFPPSVVLQRTTEQIEHIFRCQYPHISKGKHVLALLKSAVYQSVNLDAVICSHHTY